MSDLIPSGIWTIASLVVTSPSRLFNYRDFGLGVQRRGTCSKVEPTSSFPLENKDVPGRQGRAESYGECFQGYLPRERIWEDVGRNGAHPTTRVDANCGQSYSRYRRGMSQRTGPGPCGPLEKSCRNNNGRLWFLAFKGVSRTLPLWRNEPSCYFGVFPDRTAYVMIF